MSNAVQSKTTREPRGNEAFAEASVAAVVPIRIGEESDPLASFRPEGADGRPAAPPRSPAATRASFTKPTLVIVGAAAAVVLAAVVGSMLWRSWLKEPLAKPVALVGTLTLNSRPAGAAVVVDGTARGATPVDLQLEAGDHEVVLKSATGERKIRVAVERGTRTIENVDMPAAEPQLAELEVTSVPAGARVIVDGKAAGQTPLKVHDLEAGRHAVAIGTGSSTVNRTVDVTAGATASLFVSLGAATGAPTGNVVVESPAELRLLESGQLLGLSNAAPLPLSVGRHQLDLVNDALELRLTRTVTIEAGKVTRVSVPAPDGALFVNAAPWAEVFLDGRSIGVTPLGNVAVPVGTHDVVWRHPQLGERRRSITVGARTPVRIAVDMTR